jgi:membrane fusion protein (multidrug efflux system)
MSTVPAAVSSSSTDLSGQASAPADRPRPTRRYLLLGLAALVMVGLIVFGLWYFLEGRWHESTDDAYVNGNVVQITPQVSGKFAVTVMPARVPAV